MRGQRSDSGGHSAPRLLRAAGVLTGEQSAATGRLGGQSAGDLDPLLLLVKLLL